jgi:hypothetical protein
VNRSSEGRHAQASPSSRVPDVWRVVSAGLLVVAVVAIVSAIYLRPFLDRLERFPHGTDTPGYVHRSLLVSEEGLNALTPFGDRPAHPIVTSVLRDVTGGAPLDLARAWPAIFAVAIALAAAALGSGVAAERPWVGAALGAGLAASPFVALTAIGYASNLLLDAIAVALIALAVRVRSGGRGGAAIVLLLGAAAIAHWLFAVLLIALLATYVAGALLVTRLRRRSDGAWRGPRRLAVAIGLGALLGLLLVLVSPERPTRVPSPKQDAAGKIAVRLPEMALGITIPLAAVGGAAMWASRRPPTRRTLPPLALWALAAPAGLIAWKLLDVTIPHRNVPFALGVPFLIVLGAAATRPWTEAIATRRRRPAWGTMGAAASTVLVLVAATWLAARGADTWETPAAAFTPSQYAQARVLSAYLETVPPDTRIVIPMGGRWRPIRALMVTLPPERFLDVRAWLTNFFGDTERFRRRLEARFPPGSVGVYLAGYGGQIPLQGTRLGPGVTLLAGPRPAADLAVPPAAVTGPGELVRLTITSLVTMLVLGLGWAIALTGLPAFAVVCVAPAMGTAMISLGGFVVGRLGMPLGAGGGVLVAMGVGLLGWLAVLIGSRRPAEPDEPEPEPGTEDRLLPFLSRKGGRHLAGQPGVRVE